MNGGAIYTLRETHTPFAVGLEPGAVAVRLERGGALTQVTDRPLVWERGEKVQLRETGSRPGGPCLTIDF